MLVMVLFLLFSMPLAFADDDWRDGFPYLYIYDELIKAETVKDNLVMDDSVEITNNIIENNIIENNIIEYTSENNDDSITYFVYDIPDYANFKKDIVYEALNEWESLNPQLEFREISNREQADIQIIFVQVVNESNEPKSPTINGYYLVMVDYIEDDCFYSYNTIKDSIKHEIGHTLGLEHSSDENNLMWGPDGTNNFDDLGYKIPKVHPIELDCH